MPLLRVAALIQIDAMCGHRIGIIETFNTKIENFLCVTKFNWCEIEIIFNKNQKNMQ